MTEQPTRKRQQPGQLARAQVPTPEQLEREARVLRMRQEHRTFAYIAAEEGYADKAGAHKAYERALSRVHAPAAADVREQERQSLDRLSEIVWEILLDDKRLIETRLKAVDRILRVMERRAKLLGLDHEHGIAERTLALEADRVRVVAIAFARTLDLLAGTVGLTTEQRQAMTRTFLTELRATVDEAGNVVDQDGAPVVSVPELDGPSS